MVKTKSQVRLALLDCIPTPMPMTDLPTVKDVLLDYYHNKKGHTHNSSYNEIKKKL